MSTPVPDVPPEIAAQMRVLSAAALATQPGDVILLRQDAERMRDTADAARNEAELPMAFADLRAQLTACDEELLGVGLESRALEERARTLESSITNTGYRPPQRLPSTVEVALDYVAQALGHPVYARWTLTVLKRGCPPLAGAKREHPAVFPLLLRHHATIEYSDHRRLRAVPETLAPSAGAGLARFLRQHRRRLRLARPRRRAGWRSRRGKVNAPSPVTQDGTPLPAWGRSP